MVGIKKSRQQYIHIYAYQLFMATLNEMPWNYIDTFKRGFCSMFTYLAQLTINVGFQWNVAGLKQSPCIVGLELIPYIFYWHTGQMSSNNRFCPHYNDVIIGAMTSQITSLKIVHSTVYSGSDQRKHQSSASLAFVWGIHRGPVNSPHKWPVMRKMLPFDDVIMLTINICDISCDYSFQIPSYLTPVAYQVSSTGKFLTSMLVMWTRPFIFNFHNSQAGQSTLNLMRSRQQLFQAYFQVNVRLK